MRSLDPDDLTGEEVETLEDELVDQASAARTIQEIEAEIVTLTGLEQLAKSVRDSGTDRKWEELSGLLQNAPEMFDASGGSAEAHRVHRASRHPQLPCRSTADAARAS